MLFKLTMSLVLVGLAFAAVLASPPAAAQAGWKEYAFAKDGFAARYPAQPVLTDHPYETRLASAVIERLYSVETGGIIYAVAIADFGAARPNRDKAIDEAAERLMGMGRLTHDVSARLNWNYGRELRVEAPDGTSYTNAIFLIGSKLVQLKVTYSMPNSDPAESAGIHYFQQAVRLLD